MPGLTEILFALELNQRIAGVSEYCRYPEAARAKPKIGSFLQPNLEAIAALKPDIVYIIKNPIRLKAKLEALKLRVEELDLETLPGILSAIDSIGQHTGKAGQAARLRRDLEMRLERVKARVRRRQSSAFLVGRTPQRLEGMIAVGPGSYIGELMKAAGGDNIFADSPAMYPRISIEQLLARQPAVLFEMGDAVHAGQPDSKYREDVLSVWAKIPGLAAVKKGRVYPLNEDLFVVPGPRFAEAAERLYALLNEAGRP